MAMRSDGWLPGESSRFEHHKRVFVICRRIEVAGDDDAFLRVHAQRGQQQNASDDE